MNSGILIIAEANPPITRTGKKSKLILPGAAMAAQVAATPRKINPPVFCDLLFCR